jgi:hypothetical protein
MSVAHTRWGLAGLLLGAAGLLLGGLLLMWRLPGPQGEHVVRDTSAGRAARASEAGAKVAVMANTVAVAGLPLPVRPVPAASPPSRRLGLPTAPMEMRVRPDGGQSLRLNGHYTHVATSATDEQGQTCVLCLAGGAAAAPISRSPASVPAKAPVAPLANSIIYAER